MLYCKGCECIIVPGRAYLVSGGYYCPHCMEHMNLSMRENEGTSVAFRAPSGSSRDLDLRDRFRGKEVL